MHVSCKFSRNVPSVLVVRGFLKAKSLLRVSNYSKKMFMTSSARSSSSILHNWNYIVINIYPQYILKDGEFLNFIFN